MDKGRRTVYFFLHELIEVPASMAAASPARGQRKNTFILVRAKFTEILCSKIYLY